MVVKTQRVETAAVVSGLGNIVEVNEFAELLKGAAETLTDAAGAASGAADDATDAAMGLDAAASKVESSAEMTAEAAEQAELAAQTTTQAAADVKKAAEVAEDAGNAATDAAIDVSGAANDLRLELGKMQERLDEIVGRMSDNERHSQAEAGRGYCAEASLLLVGESCVLTNLGVTFAITEQGAAFPTDDAPVRRGWIQADWVIGGEHHTFQAVEVSDGRWRIYAGGQWQPVAGRDCQVGAGVEPGQYCVWRGNIFRVYATNDLVTDREHAVQFTEGYDHLELQFWPDGYDDQLISVTDEFEDKQGNSVSRKFIAQRDPESDTRAWIVICAD